MKNLNTVPNIRLMNIASLIAKDHYGGHFTLLTFTTNVKFSFSTVTDREEIIELEAYTDINDAIENAIQNHLKQIKK